MRDQGIGIPPNETKRIFGRFYRTPWALTQRVKGTGLGLFIVAQTAKRHGGRAFAQSDGVGRGATFTLELPAAPNARPRALTPTPMSRLLIVEDEAHIASGLRYNLEAEGHDVTLTDNGEAALAELEADPSRIDLVVLDVMLPGIDGFTVAARMRARGWLTPILMLTARGRAEDVLRGFEAGADDYLPKPFELSILHRAHQRAAPPPCVARREPRAASTAGARGRRPRQMCSASRTRPWTSTPRSCRCGAKTYPLTLMEANLLRYLVQHEGKAISRKNMLEDVWNLREDTDTRAIDHFIARLRKYIEKEPARPRHLLTVRGVGYKFVARIRNSRAPSGCRTPPSPGCSAPATSRRR